MHSEFSIIESPKYMAKKHCYICGLIVYRWSLAYRKYEAVLAVKILNICA